MLTAGEQEYSAPGRLGKFAGDVEIARSTSISSAAGADIEHLGLDRGHRTLTITRTGGKVVTVPLAPRTARETGLAVVERTDGPVFLAADGRRLDRHGAGRIVRKTARRAGIAKTVTPHTQRRAFITAALDAGSRCATSKKPPLMQIREPQCGMTGPVAASTGMRPTSSPPTSRVPPGKAHRLAQLRPAVAAAGRSCPSNPAVTYSYSRTNENRRFARLLEPGDVMLGTIRSW